MIRITLIEPTDATGETAADFDRLWPPFFQA
jgi:hypothetical protein